MIELELTKFIKNKCNIDAYFLTAPKKIKLPYVVFYQLYTDKAAVNNNTMRLTTTFRVEFYADNKENLLNLAYNFKNAINRYRGTVGTYQDTYISCSEPVPLALDDETYKVIIELTIKYYELQELQYGR